MVSCSEKVVLITGCSSGFGLATARYLNTKGYTVIAALRNPVKLEQLQISNEIPESIDCQILDVTEPESIKAVVDYITQKYTKLNTLINNAGFGMAGFFYDLTAAHYRSVMETNFLGTTNVTKAFLPLLMKSPGSHIINISSIDALSPAPGISPYVASKAALEAFSEALRMELTPFSIHISLIEPGPYATPIQSANTQIGTGCNNPDSPFYHYSKRMLYEWHVRNGKLKRPLQDVAVLIEKLLSTKHPKFRNPIGPQALARYYMHKILPDWFYQFLIQKIVMGN